MGSCCPRRVHPEEEPLKGVDLTRETGGLPAGPQLKRDLTSRHMQMIAIGGAIGMGLFMGTGGALRDAGPASLLIAFSLVGCMIYCMVMALGELAVLYPVEGSFATYFSRFIDPALGFAMGWNYAISWLAVLPLELSAAALVIDYWKPVVDAGVWIGILLVMLCVINAFGVKGYGDAEIAFSLFKVLACLGFLGLGVAVLAGAGPKQVPFGKTWEDPGPFANGIEGFCSVFVLAAFTFGGTEMVGLASAEAANPQLTIPAASRQVTFRILLFYLGSLVIIGLIVPSNHPNLGGGTGVLHSPFVIALEMVGIDSLASAFNVVILVAILSVGNSSVYGASRTLHAMAKRGQAPYFLGYTDQRGRPVGAIIFSLAFGLIAFSGQAGNEVRDQVFTFLLSVAGSSMVITWFSIGWVHIRWRQAWKAAGHSVHELPFVSHLGSLGSWFVVCFLALVLLAQLYIAIFPLRGTATVLSFFQAYTAVPLVLLFFFAWKLWHRTPFMVIASAPVSSSWFRIRHPASWCIRTEEMEVETGRVSKEST